MVVSPLVRAFASRIGRRRAEERDFFDPNFYLSTYADVTEAGADPFSHFVGFGWREGRNPSAAFDTLFYRDFHLKGLQQDPLAHWLAAGAFASGLPTQAPTQEVGQMIQREVVAEHFDIGHYRGRGGAAAAAKDAIGHYLTDGWREGLSPSASFDPDRYVKANAHVAALGVSPFYHWCSQQRMNAAAAPPATAPAISRDEMRRVIAPAFDRTFYIASNADVRQAGLDPLDHYLDHGSHERRDPHPLFDSRFYVANNSDVATSRMPPYYHYMTIGRAAGRRGNPVGTSLYPPMKAPDDWRRATPAADVAGAACIVVIPVYRGRDETLAAVHAVLSAPQTVRFALHLVDDCSPDPALVAALERLAALGFFSLETNPRNLGFVKTCNRALARFVDKEIVLLNADALVSGDWLDRLTSHARRDPTIATITPYSNNATICSYPVNNYDNRIATELDAAALDGLAAKTNAGRVSDVPTGVGFCFFMSRASRQAIGLFDEAAFGRGYGEENDFCLRAAKAGFRNVMAEDVFVYHRGAVSFAEVAVSEYGRGQRALHNKHPDYSSRVAQHLRADPGLPGRMRFDLERLARFAGRRSLVFVSHALDGGIVTHIRHMEARLRAEGVIVVHLRVGVRDRWSVEISCNAREAPFLPNLVPSPWHQVAASIAEFLGRLSPLAVHVHSLVDFDWRPTIGLFELVRDAGIPYYFTLHDYSVVCHRNDLVSTNGRYCGLPGIEACRVCIAGDRSYPEGIDPVLRRDAYTRFLAGAAAVFAPSRDIADRLHAAGAGYAITVHPHEDVAIATQPVASRDTRPLRIAVVGAIGPHKGSRVLLGLARDALARDLPIQFHIIGYSDVSDELKGLRVTETGRYADDAEAIEKLRTVGPALMLLPSIWPETFCYTLSLAFRLGIPPVVFDLGAQAERVRGSGFGTVLPRALIDDPSAMNDRLLALSRNIGPPAPCQATHYDNMLRDYYALPPRLLGPECGR